MDVSGEERSKRGFLAGDLYDGDWGADPGVLEKGEISSSSHFRLRILTY